MHLVENKTLLKTVFIWNVVLCTCMNEWIYSTDNFSNQAVVDFKIQSSHTEKAPKNDRQKWTSMYQVIFVTLLTNKSQAHGETITDLYTENIVYTDNITSTLMIVVFLINWSRMFALYVRRMCCKLELKTLNNRKTTASFRNHRKSRVCSDPCICMTQQYKFFSPAKFWGKIWTIFPLIVWYCCNIQCPYKISNILYKTNEKAVSFLSTTSRTSRDLSWVPSFSQPHGVSLFGNTERCVVVFFSGPM